ncbi:MAG TPA: histidine phosphatase family protein [Rhodoblastus sp.]|nr:histidine phosphatase family protein [Rhodoblastus sp.]
MAYDPATPLFFFRHGETFYNAEGRIQGQLDTPLSPLGRAQAGEAGRKLGAALAQNGLAFDRIGWFASPLSRACDTMDIARGALGLPQDDFIRDKRLMELCFGRWQDLTWPEIDARYPGAVAARKADFWNFRPPDGESYADLAARVRAFLDERAGPAVVAAHGGVARALMALIGGVAPEETHAMPVYQGRLLVFSGGRGRWE